MIYNFFMVNLSFSLSHEFAHKLNDLQLKTFRNNNSSDPTDFNTYESEHCKSSLESKVTRNRTKLHFVTCYLLPFTFFFIHAIDTTI